MARVEIRLLTVGYVTALMLVAGLLGVAHFYSREVISAQASDGHVINLAGRQRMLSQRMAKELLLMVHAKDNSAVAQHAGRLHDSLQTWQLVHSGLQHGDKQLRLPGKNSQEVTGLFHSLAPHHHAIRAGVRQLLGKSTPLPSLNNPQVRRVLRASSRYLSWMDHIVFQYDREARDRVHQLERRETTALVAALILLGLEALLIFRPLVLRIRRSQRQLQHANDELARDVARRIRVEAELEQLARVKDEFLRIASHDLKSPLTIILGSASVILETVKPGKPMTQTCHTLLERMVANAQVMKQIVEDFVDFQALEDGRVKLRLADTDAADLARGVLDRMTEYAGSRNVDLVMEVEPPLDPCCMDENRVGQVIANLLHNAIKFSPDGGRVQILLGQAEGGLELSVSDQGPGLMPEDMPRVFDKYAQLANQPCVAEKSSGLGLAICKELVQLHDGEIGVRANEPQGATFWFRLPVVPRSCCKKG